MFHAGAFPTQAPTAPDVIWKMLMKIFKQWDMDAMDRDPSTKQPIIADIVPGAVVKKLESIPETDLIMLLRLPYQDMFRVLHDVLETNKLLEHVS